MAVPTYYDLDLMSNTSANTGHPTPKAIIFESLARKETINMCLRGSVLGKQPASGYCVLMYTF